MKKLIISGVLILCLGIMFSFVNRDGNENEIKITVTAEHPTSFDMYHNSKTTKGLSTPYEFTIRSNSEKLIFRAEHMQSKLNIKVEKEGALMTADWPITVLLINGSQLSTFGMN